MQAEPNDLLLELPAMSGRTELTITWATLGKILLAVLFAYLAVRLWPLLALLLLGLLIAIALAPIVAWTTRKQWPRWSGVLLCGLVLVSFVFLLVAILVPTFGGQAGALITNLPALREQWFANLPTTGPIRAAADRLLSSPAFSDPEPVMKQFFAAFGVAVAGVTKFLLVLIFAMYFVADGPRIYRWLRAFLPPPQRERVDTAAQEITDVVGHYVIGQAITSALCGTFAFLVLWLLRVPNAGLLAILAAVFDVLPLIGFFLFAIPAVALAFTVSPGTAALAALLYSAYHLFENYFIVPKVYGDRLRLSTLTVLISCLAAGMLAGVIGVIIVLPVVASYPVIERIWLRPYLERDTVAKHEQIDASEHGAR